MISIPIVGIILAIIGFILHILTAPYTVLVAFLLEKGKDKSRWEQETEEIWGIYDRELALANMDKRAEIEWRIHHWRRFMEDGLSPKEADQRVRQLDYKVWRQMT
ncbi:hypothetical protein ES708_15168 [subsurface metagenome]